MTEPMTDAEVTVLESFLTDRPEIETISMQVRRVERLLGRLYATAAERDAERALRTAAEAARDAALARAMPDGWVAVPREPTDAMYAAALRVTRDPGYGHVHDAAGGSVYRAMIAAAPPIPTPTQEG